MNKIETKRALQGNGFRALRSKRGLAEEAGSQLIELALVLPLLLLILVGAIDFGRAFYVAMEVQSAAESGALYGLQYPTDIAGMQSAAGLDVSDLSNLSTAATYGTECSDGTLAVALSGTPPHCSADVVQYVEVDTQAMYEPILPYPGIPSQLSLSGRSRMRATF